MIVRNVGYSVYTVLERLIRYLEKGNVDIKFIDKLKECKDLVFIGEE